MAGGRHRGYVPYDAILVDDDGGAIRDPGLLEIETVEAGDSALGMKISEKGQADAFQVPGGPVGVAVDTVHADAEDLGVCLAEIIEPRFQRGDFLASGGGPVEGIEDEHDVPLLLVVR